MNALHIDVASLSTEQMIALASAGILKFDAPSQSVNENVTVAPVTESVEPVDVDEISRNKAGDPDAHVDYPQTWTRERLNATTVKGKNAKNRLQHIANAVGITNFNGVMYPERHGSEPVKAINEAVNSLPGSDKFSPKDRLVEAILLQYENLPAFHPERLHPMPQSHIDNLNANRGGEAVRGLERILTTSKSEIAKVQAQLREINGEVDTIDALPAEAKQYTQARRDELVSMADGLIAELDALNSKANAHDPFASVVSQPATKREVRQASIAAMGRLNPAAWGDDKAGRMRQPTIIKDRYDNAAKHAPFIRKTYALMQEHLQNVNGKDERKAIYARFNELTSQIDGEWVSGCRNSESSIDHWQCYVWLRDGKVLPNPVFGTTPTEEALEAKAAKLNRDPKDVARSNRAKKAARTRKANARNK